MSIKLYASMAVQRHRRSHGQNVAVDEADVSMLGKLITGDVKLNNLSGPSLSPRGLG